jgi:hypothetical protein
VELELLHLSAKKRIFLNDVAKFFNTVTLASFIPPFFVSDELV